MTKKKRCCNIKSQNQRDSPISRWWRKVQWEGNQNPPEGFQDVRIRRHGSTWRKRNASDAPGSGRQEESGKYFIFLNLFLLNIEGKEDLVNEKIIREKISRIEYYLRRNSTKADASERWTWDDDKKIRWKKIRYEKVMRREEV